MLLPKYFQLSCHCGLHSSESHIEWAHPRDAKAPVTVHTEEVRACRVCSKQVFKSKYLSHFKDQHSDVRLGCPKCENSYHSPDLLNAHYQHSHLEENKAEFEVKAGKTTIRNVRLLLRCRVCNVLVTNLSHHMEEFHVPDIVVYQGRQSLPRQLTKKELKPNAKTEITCNICDKTFVGQRYYANHLRRKDFCRPPTPPMQMQPTEKKNKSPPKRIGILRRR